MVRPVDCSAIAGVTGKTSFTLRSAEGREPLRQLRAFARGDEGAGELLRRENRERSRAIPNRRR